MSDKPLDQYHFLKLGEDTLKDPYPFFARLRREAPVFKEPDYGVYLVTRYDDVTKVARTPDIYSAIVNAADLICRSRFRQWMRSTRTIRIPLRRSYSPTIRLFMADIEL